MKIRRKIVLLVCIVLFSFTAKAQVGWLYNFGYRYLNAPVWDSIAMTYNFTRPWSAEPMPLFTHGFNVELGNYYAPWNNIAFAPTLGYQWCRSVAVGQLVIAPGGDETTYRLKATINNFDLHTSCMFRAFNFKHKDTTGWRYKLQVEADPGLSVFMPGVREEKERIELEEGEPYRPITAAFRLGLGVCYQSKLSKHWALLPYARVAWMPTAELRDFSSAVLGSYYPNLHDDSVVWMTEFGFRFLLLPDKKEKETDEE